MMVLLEMLSEGTFVGCIFVLRAILGIALMVL